MYYGHNTGEDIKKFVGLPHSGLIILFLIIGFLSLFLNGIIHNGSKPLEYFYRFLFYSALFAFVYGLFLSYQIIQKDYVYIGVFILAIVFVFSYRKGFATNHLKGSYFLQNGIIKAKNGENYYEVESLSNNYTILAEDFIKDDNAVYYLSNRINGMDPNTCEIVYFDNKPTLYIKDAKNVFYTDEILDNSDPKTFQVVKFKDIYYNAKDKNYTYYDREQYIEEKNSNDKEPNLIRVKSKKELEEDKVKEEEQRIEDTEKLEIRKFIAKSEKKDKNGLVDYITDIPLPKVNLDKATTEIKELNNKGVLSLGLDRHPEKLYRLYQIYLNNDNAKAFDYLKRASLAFTKDSHQGSSSFLARYDYAYRLLIGKGIDKDVNKALMLLAELKDKVEEIKSYDGLASGASHEKAGLTMKIDWSITGQPITTKPITPMDIYHESCYLLAKVYLQGKLVSKDLILAEKHARPLANIFYYDQDWSLEKKVNVRRFFLMYIDIIQNSEYTGEIAHLGDLFEMLIKMKFPVGHFKEAMYYYNKKEEIDIPKEGYSAATYFAYACNDGYAEGCYMAGKIYEEEKKYKKGDKDKYGNTERDPFLIAFLYYEAGANLGNPKCKYKLGECYLNGRWYKDEVLMSTNKVLAKKWLKKASEDGIIEAMELLNQL